MKVLLVAVNSKYSHTNLAVRLLKAYSKSHDVEFLEYTINEPKFQVLSDIFKKDADAYFFSCYIWNIEYIKDLASSLSKITNAKIILGGPEVSFNTKDFMQNNPYVDACIIGEGEMTFSTLLNNGLNFKDTKGIVWRDNEIIENSPQELIPDISEIPFPYTKEELLGLKDRLIYYESSRGCPFNCSYCMSSTIKGVRYRSLELVKQELKLFSDCNIKIVKMVDRTFNADNKRVYEIFKFLIENAKNTTYHFEIAAHILTDEVLELLKSAPKGLFQFEIGVQSTNPETILAINRKTDFKKISYVVSKILSYKNIHIHLDLIAGLPYEDLKTFKKSFNDVFSLHADMLQLGFLKLLHGTKIRDEELLHDYKYLDKPPYEVLANKYIGFNELSELKKVEDMVDKFYNSGDFKKSLDFLIKGYSSAYDLFLDLSEFFTDNKLYSKSALFDIMFSFGKKQKVKEVFFDLLKFDFIKSGNFRTPSWSLIPYSEELNKKRFKLIEENPDIFAEYSHLPLREIIKLVHFETFKFNILSDFSEGEFIYVFKKDGSIHKLNN